MVHNNHLSKRAFILVIILFIKGHYDVIVVIRFSAQTEHYGKIRLVVTGPGPTGYSMDRRG